MARAGRRMAPLRASRPARVSAPQAQPRRLPARARGPGNVPAATAEQRQAVRFRLPPRKGFPPFCRLSGSIPILVIPVPLITASRRASSRLCNIWASIPSAISRPLTPAIRQRRPRITRSPRPAFSLTLSCLVMGRSILQTRCRPRLPLSKLIPGPSPRSRAPTR